ncbi:hypothetical protein [Desulfococcus sp.]|uniref:hypothetical protein n=1 Tax=Desulfococcus sp. TaxID=2025834 RepID=UPI003593D752
MEGATVNRDFVGFADDDQEFYPGIAAWTCRDEVRSLRHINLNGGHEALYDEANQVAYLRMPVHDSAAIRLITQTGERLNLIVRDAGGGVYINIVFALHVEAFGTPLERRLIMHRLWVDILEALTKMEEMR